MTLGSIKLSSAAVNNSIGSGFIVLLTPFIVWFWMWLSKKKAEPNSAIKFVLALILLGLAFYIFVIGSNHATKGMVSLLYFSLGYLLMTLGELCISPIGLSAITKLSPQKMVGLMMGVWFLASSYGQYLAGLIGSLMALPGESETGKTMAATESLAIYAGVFTKIAWASAACGIVLLLLYPWMKKMMQGIK
jgi:proton-dependent oligopeptide transporter, POT family